MYLHGFTYSTDMIRVEIISVITKNLFTRMLNFFKLRPIASLSKRQEPVAEFWR